MKLNHNSYLIIYSNDRLYKNLIVDKKNDKSIIFIMLGFFPKFILLFVEVFDR